MRAAILGLWVLGACTYETGTASSGPVAVSLDTDVAPHSGWRPDSNWGSWETASTADTAPTGVVPTADTGPVIDTDDTSVDPGFAASRSGYWLINVDVRLDGSARGTMRYFERVVRSASRPPRDPCDLEWTVESSADLLNASRCPSCLRAWTLQAFDGDDRRMRRRTPRRSECRLWQPRTTLDDIDVAFTDARGGWVRFARGAGWRLQPTPFGYTGSLSNPTSYALSVGTPVRWWGSGAP